MYLRKALYLNYVIHKLATVLKIHMEPQNPDSQMKLEKEEQLEEIVSWVGVGCVLKLKLLYEARWAWF